MNESLPHERTLVGAVDSYLKNLAHVRPHLVKRFAWVLEEMAERWLEAGHTNVITAIDRAWLAAYLAQAQDRQVTRQAIHDFYRWAHKNGLSKPISFATAITAD